MSEEEKAPSSKDDSSTETKSPRPEGLIAEIYRQLKELQEGGRSPQSVVMSMEQYRSIQRYHASLGETPAPAFDYISKYSIMGLPVLIDNDSDLRVIDSPPSSGE